MRGEEMNAETAAAIPVIAASASASPMRIYGTDEHAQFI